MVQVESEAILEIDYVPATSTLYVRFVEGDWYSYFAMPQSVHRALLQAESHGRFFHDHTRDHYPYSRGR